MKSLASTIRLLLLAVGFVLSYEIDKAVRKSGDEIIFCFVLQKVKRAEKLMRREAAL